MDITFGILTCQNQQNVNVIIESIISQAIPRFEIIVVGDVNDIWNRENIKITNDSTANKKNHISRKKNIIIEKSTMPIIVMLKDYVSLGPRWYDGMIKYGNDFDIIMNKIEDKNNNRYLDWIWENPEVGSGRNIGYDINDHDGMFCPGVMTIAKKYVFQEFQFNENMIGLGKPTDVEWSKRAMKKYSYKMNISSKCILIERHNRYPRFRRACNCSRCKNIGIDK